MLEIVDEQGEVVSSFESRSGGANTENAGARRGGRNRGRNEGDTEGGNRGRGQGRNQGRGQGRGQGGGGERRGQGGAPDLGGDPSEFSGGMERYMAMMRNRGRGAAQGRLEKTAGAHRFVWNMQARSSGGGGGRGGFMRGGRSVAPGSYQVRLTVDGETHSVPLQIELDPRLVAEGVTADDIRAQQAFVKEVSAVSGRASTLASNVRNWQRHLDGLIEDGKGNANIEKALEQLNALDARLNTKRGGRYQQPMLTSQLSYLSSNAGRGDQAPNNHALMRLEALTKELESCEAEFAKVDAPKPPEPTRGERQNRRGRRR